MGTGIKRWEGFRGLRTYQPVLQADLRELERVVQETQRTLGSLLDVDPIGGTTVINTTNITNISNATADPSAFVTLTAVNGSAGTAMRSDAAPPLSQAISPTWTGVHTFSPSADLTPVTINVTAGLATADIVKVLALDATTLVKIDNLGLVGINTETPDALLTIQSVEGTLEPPIASPEAWYIPESIVEDAGGIEPASGTALSTWRDSSGNGHDLTAGRVTTSGGAGSTYPGYYRAGHTKAATNMAAVCFEAQTTTGNNIGYFSMATRIDFNRTAGWTIAMIVRDYNTNNEPNTSYLMGVDDADPNYFVYFKSAFGTNTTRVGESDNGSSGYFSDDVAHTEGNDLEYIVCRVDTTANSNAMRAWFDGMLATSLGQTYGTNDPFLRYLGLYISGASSYGGCWGRSICELIIWDRALSDSEVATVNTYLAGRVAGTIVSSSPYDLTHWYDSTSTLRSRIDSIGRFGYGTAPSYPVDVLKDTTQQRLGYDSSNYYTTTVGSTGVVTFDAVGSGASFVFSDAVTIGALTLTTLTVNGASTLNGVTTITSTTQPQLVVRYDSSNRLDLSVSSAGVVTMDAVGASAAFTFNDNVGIGVTPTTNKLQVLSTTIPQVRLSYDTTHFTTHEVAADGSMVIRPNTDDTSGLIQCLIRPATALTSTTADGRATFAVRRSAGANPTSIICYANGLVEFGGSNGFATDAIIAVRSSIGKSAGIHFAPASSSSTGGTYGGLSAAVTGAYFATTPGATPAATNYVGGVFETALPALSTDVTGLYAGVFRPVGVSASNGARTITSTYGFAVIRMPGSAGFGNYTTVYGGYIDQAFLNAPDGCTNDYGLYLEARKHGSTINNGIFINCDATVGQRAIAMRSQNEFIHSGAAGNLTFGAGTDFVINIGGSDVVSVQAALWQINVNQFDFQLPTGIGTKWGTSTGEKQAWWGYTPVTQPDGSTPVHTTLDTLGLRVDAGGDPYGIVCYDNEVVCYDDVVVTI